MDTVQIVIFVYFQIAICYLFYSIYKFNELLEKQIEENEYAILCLCAILCGDKKIIKESIDGVIVYAVAENKKESRE